LKTAGRAIRAIPEAELAAAPQGNNWKDVPVVLPAARATMASTGQQVRGKPLPVPQTGHVGGAATSDALCYICHSAVSIDLVYHQIQRAPTSGPNIPSGAARIEYEIYKVDVNAGNQPVVTFRILKNGSPVSFNAYTGEAVARPADLIT